MNTSLIPKLKPKDAPELQRFVDSGAERDERINARRGGIEIPVWSGPNRKVAMCAVDAENIIHKPVESWRTELSLDSSSGEIKPIQHTGVVREHECIEFNNGGPHGAVVEDLQLVADCLGMSSIDDLTIMATEQPRVFPVMVKGDGVLALISPVS